MEKNMYEDIMKQMIGKILTYKIVQREQIRGCSEAELLRLEAHYHVTLPQAFRAFLKYLGKNTEYLTHDGFLSYEYLINMKEGFMAMLEEDGYDNDIPANTFFIAESQGMCYFYFLLEPGKENPPIYRWLNDEISQSYASFTDWLDARIEEKRHCMEIDKIREREKREKYAEIFKNDP